MRGRYARIFYPLSFLFFHSWFPRALSLSLSLSSSFHSKGILNHILTPLSVSTKFPVIPPHYGHQRARRRTEERAPHREPGKHPYNRARQGRLVDWEDCSAAGPYFRSGLIVIQRNVAATRHELAPPLIIRGATSAVSSRQKWRGGVRARARVVQARGCDPSIACAAKGGSIFVEAHWRGGAADSPGQVPKMPQNITFESRRNFS